jgi:hypothetical protein
VVAPAAQLSTASSLSKGKEIPSATAATTSPPPTEKVVSFSFSLLMDLLPIAPEPIFDFSQLNVDYGKYTITLAGANLVFFFFL